MSRTCLTTFSGCARKTHIFENQSIIGYSANAIILVVPSVAVSLAHDSAINMQQTGYESDAPRHALLPTMVPMISCAMLLVKQTNLKYYLPHSTYIYMYISVA